MVLLACTSSRQEEDVNITRDLCCRLIDIIVLIASSTSERLEPAHQELTPGVSSLGSELLANAPLPKKVTSAPPPTSELLLEPATPVTPATGLFLEPATPIRPCTATYLYF